MKNVSKKTIGMIAAAALSVVVFTSTAMAASRNVSGYEKVRESMFRYYEQLNKNRSNFTVGAGLRVRVDDEEIVSMDMEAAQQDNYNSYNKNSYTYGGVTFSDESSYNNGVTISYDSVKDTYYMSGRYFEPDYDFDNTYSSDNELTSNQRKLVSVILDMFAGDAKNYCFVEGNVVTCRLERGQIPEFFQALLGVVSEQLSENLSGYSYSVNRLTDSADLSADELLENSLLSIINNASFESVDCRGILDDDDLLNDVFASVIITGNDTDGNPHTVTIDVTGSVSDMGTTVVNPLDTTGKRVVDNTWTDDDYYYDYSYDIETGERVLDALDDSGALEGLSETEIRQMLEDPAYNEKFFELIDGAGDIIDVESDEIDGDFVYGLYLSDDLTDAEPAAEAAPQ